MIWIPETFTGLGGESLLFADTSSTMGTGREPRLSPGSRGGVARAGEMEGKAAPTFPRWLTSPGPQPSGKVRSHPGAFSTAVWAQFWLLSGETLQTAASRGAGSTGVGADGAAGLPTQGCACLRCPPLPAHLLPLPPPGTSLSFQFLPSNWKGGQAVIGVAFAGATLEPGTQGMGSGQGERPGL